VRWVTPEKLHLTLVFLGATDPRRVDALKSAVRLVAARHAAFRVETGAAGGRINEWRGGVAWLRLGEGAAHVSDLALDVDRELGSATYDAKRRPRPHLTVARGATDEALRDLRAVADRLRLGWTAERLVLFRSHTERTGSRYEVLLSASLLQPQAGEH